MSKKTVADRLLIKPNTTVWTTNPEHLTLIEGLPDSAQVVDGPAEATTALIFASDAASLRSTLTVG